MPDIMINCPTTGKPLSTGMSMDAGSFESAQLEENTLGPCPHCAATHTWSKTGAFLQE